MVMHLVEVNREHSAFADQFADTLAAEPGKPARTGHRIALTQGQRRFERRGRGRRRLGIVGGHGGDGTHHALALQSRLVRQGYRLRVYIPFGEDWFPYFMRRLAERPANLLFFAKNLLRGTASE